MPRHGLPACALLSLSDARCTGVGCCQMPISIGCSSYDMQYMWLDVSRPPEHDPVGLQLVLIAEQGWIKQQASSTRGAPHLEETPVPVLLGSGQSDQHLSPEGIRERDDIFNTSSSHCLEIFYSARAVQTMYSCSIQYSVQLQYFVTLRIY